MIGKVHADHHGFILMHSLKIIVRSEIEVLPIMPGKKCTSNSKHNILKENQKNVFKSLSQQFSII